MGGWEGGLGGTDVHEECVVDVDPKGEVVGVEEARGVDAHQLRGQLPANKTCGGWV